jgi:hypothetical protein
VISTQRDGEPKGGPERRFEGLAGFGSLGNDLTKCDIQTQELTPVTGRGWRVFRRRESEVLD